jgi:large subunit ribosomal protein L36
MLAGAHGPGCENGYHLQYGLVAGRWNRRRVVKVRKSLRSLKQKPGAQVIRRHGKTFVINKKNPRHKARQG